MRVFETYAEYEAAGHERPAQLRCAQCLQLIDLNPGNGASGYGLTGERPNFRAICYACCFESDKRELLDRTKPFFAYLAGDGRTVTNWPGSTLGTVTHESSARNGFNRSKITCIRMRDVHGAMWQGRGPGRGPGRGMYIRLRPMKG